MLGKGRHEEEGMKNARILWTSFVDGPIGMAFGLYKPVPLIPQYVLL